MTMQNKVATVFGGTGFIGAQVVRELAKKGWTVKVATRVPERAYELRTCGTVGQIVPFAVDYNDPKSLAGAVSGAAFVVNCIGILYGRGRKVTFARIHAELPGQIARACDKEGVARFVHISALGCEQGRSKYAQSKLEGEKAVLKAFPSATILRPGIVFGPGDNFFNMFAELARYVPALPLIGGGRTKFQPVYVGDVADAVMAALTLPEGESGPQGRIYELGGPEVVSFREIYERIFTLTRRRRMLVSLPWGVAKIEATFLSLLPRPLLTRDQVESLKTDNVVADNVLTLKDLDVTPTGMALILPGYLERYQPGGKFGAKDKGDKIRA